jgi:hypothetical protein
LPRECKEMLIRPGRDIVSLVMETNWKSSIHTPINK